ncbi:unnamed protein product [Angiostrongylus costaricensis]|uniref:LRRCT domain-containing protein n=1 Tax=Angiostrongylus costaricensis TaxID=334426 RepID=A0A0R3PX40_ANGCS|nr:unnamed protein product [Angiostrongylus costaricensis]
MQSHNVLIVFAKASHEAWHRCDCVPVGNDGSVHVVCHRLLASTVPSLPTVSYQPQPTPNVIALSMTEGDLTFIQQDAFRMNDIQALDFSDNQIQTVNVNAFRGLEMKLTHLSLRRNNLTVIPTWALTYLHQLQVLRLDGNRISHIRANTFDETQLNNLHFLHLDNNQIQLIPNMAFARLRLIVLTLSNNRITHLEKLSLPSSISILELKNNLLTEIPYLALKDKTALQVLDFDGNNISSLQYNPEVSFKTELNLVLRNNNIRSLSATSLKSFRKFKELDISYNQISSVHRSAFESISHIKALDLSYNSIAYIERGTFKNLAKNLERLNLEGNIFHALPEALGDLWNLTHLNLNGNKLTRLDNKILDGLKNELVELSLAYNRLKIVSLDVFIGMTRLQHLDLSKNNINRLDRSLLSTSIGMGTNLAYLDLAGNQIKSIDDKDTFLYMGSLAHFDLSYNQIEEIEPKSIEKLARLEKLYLQNQLRIIDSLTTNFAFSELPSLRYLDLSNNVIVQILPQAFAALPVLETLLLHNNNIKAIDKLAFQHLDKIESLDISHNLLKNFSCDYLGSVRIIYNLNLAHNLITETDLMCILRSLVRLNLANNFLETTKKVILDGADALREMSLRNNGIFEIQNNAFICCPKLSMIDLSHNHLRMIRKETFLQQEFLHYLDISHNGLQSFQPGCFGKNNILSLNIASNELDRIPTEALEAISDMLTTLNLNNNRIRTLDATQFLGLRNLTQLTISGNLIEAIEEAAFEHLPVLKYLDISDNPVTTWSPSAFKDMSSSIHTLNLANTGLFSIPRMSYYAIQNFNLSMNKIHNIDRSDIARTSQLVSLDISFNNLLRLQDNVFVDLIYLKTLNIKKMLLYLETLSMHDLMSLSKLPEPPDFSHLVYNIASSFQQYEITKIIQHLPPLRSLHIELRESVIDTQLNDIDMAHMRQFTLTGKNITNISSIAFHMLRGYRFHLSITGTSIREFPESLFTALDNIHFLSLYLRNNQIRSINPFKNTVQPVVNQYGTILESIDIENPIQCDCSMLWVSKWIQLSPTHAKEFENAHCEHHVSTDNSLTYKYTTEFVNGSQCFQQKGRSINSIYLTFFTTCIIVLVYEHQ